MLLRRFLIFEHTITNTKQKLLSPKEKAKEKDYNKEDAQVKNQEQELKQKQDELIQDTKQHDNKEGRFNFVP